MRATVGSCVSFGIGLISGREDVGERKRGKEGLTAGVVVR